jgi:hypothetical protein
VESYFINKAFDKAIKDYLASKDMPEGIIYNSFLVVVIRMLIIMYGDLDIINPYKTNNEASFDSNLMKYGATIEEIKRLKRLLDGYLVLEERNNESINKEENIYFIEVQKCLIDLFNKKRLNFSVNDEDQEEFANLLYTPNCKNALRLSYNYLTAADIFEVYNYYNEKMSIKPEEKKEEKKELLNFEAYKLFNIKLEDLSKMSASDINNLNKKIYKTLNISENAINRDYLLEEKIKELTNYNEPITSGNGYVDILIIMSIILTVLMIIIVFMVFIK